MRNDETTSAGEVPQIEPIESDCPRTTDAAIQPEIRAAFEPTCCGSGCADCPF
jgi:hypothetical protein